VPGDRVRISGLWSIDPKFKSIPPWLISFFVEKFMGYAIQAYAHVANNQSVLWLRAVTGSKCG
jgi:hypothetical protein